jgi:hypothetical protein
MASFSGDDTLSPPTEIENPMTRITHCAIAFAAIVAVTASYADDSVSRATPSDHQALKACIEKQKTADVTMSKSEMTRICKDELKRQKALGESTPPPSDSPTSH